MGTDTRGVPKNDVWRRDSSQMGRHSIDYNQNQMAPINGRVAELVAKREYCL